MKTVDVILLTYGEPFQNSYWQQTVYSYRILSKLTRRVAPIPKTMLPLISVYRGWTRKKTWMNEGYTSPLERITEKQHAIIEQNLKQSGEYNWRVHTALEFRKPDLWDVLDKIRKTGTDRLVFMPMYLPVSDFTHDISWRDYTAYQQKHNDALPLARVVFSRPYLYDLADIMADFVKRKVEEKGLSLQKAQNAGLILGAHGTVIDPPPVIKDSGYADTFKMYKLLKDRLQKHFKAVDIGWLNHTVGGEWTSPPLDKTVAKMLESKIDEIVYFPFGFFADNAETQLEGKMILRDCGVTDYHQLPCVNDDAEFMQFITELIVRKTKAGEALPPVQEKVHYLKTA